MSDVVWLALAGLGLVVLFRAIWQSTRSACSGGPAWLTRVTIGAYAIMGAGVLGTLT